MHKENKNNDFIQQFVSSASPYSAILESIIYINNVCNVYTRTRCLQCLRFDLNVNNVSVYIHYIAKSIGTPSNEQVWLL